MKELSIVEKARRFDEALAMAKECITYIPDEAVNKYMLNMFPELKESDGERIRKQIISFLKEFEHDHYRSLDFSSWIAWLEKQGEQKCNNTDFSDLRTWKYIVDAVLTEKEGIGQYLDSPVTEEVAKKLQKRFGNIA